MRSQVHILPGDALSREFKDSGIEGETIICRECLIDGPVDSNSLEGFWNHRAAYINEAYSEEKNDYFKKVKEELEKVLSLDENCEVNLWFDFDLFCHANLWFCIRLLNTSKVQYVNRVYPVINEEGKVWDGFGSHTKEDLLKCFDQRVKFTKDDLELGEKLWAAYSSGNLEELKKLSEERSACFLMLDEVVKAELERKQQQRPQQSLKEIRSMGITDFKDIFMRFRAKEGIYGFGDLQVKKMLEDIQE